MKQKYSVLIICSVKDCKNNVNNSCTAGEIEIYSCNVTIDYPIVTCKSYEKGDD